MSAVNARPHPSSTGAHPTPATGAATASVWPPASSRQSGFERTRPRPEKALDVLVVDDDESSRELISIAIHSFGHRCRVAFDGADALRQLAESPADVVVSDWDMPRLNGGDLCRHVRAGGNDAPYTYFIIMTAFDDREHLLEGMAAGAD